MPPPSGARKSMLTIIVSKLAWGIAMLAAGVFAGQGLFRLSRRNPDSVVVREGLIGDFVCVGEVMLVVVGSMALLRGLLDVF